MQIHREDAVGSGGDQEIGYQLGGDRHAGLVFAILPRIAIEGQHRRDARRAGPTQRVHHDEHLHQVMVRRRRRGLNQKYVFATHVLLDFDEGLAIRKRLDGGVAKFHADIGADGLG